MIDSHPILQAQGIVGFFLQKSKLLRLVGLQEGRIGLRISEQH